MGTGTGRDGSGRVEDRAGDGDRVVGGVGWGQGQRMGMGTGDGDRQGMGMETGQGMGMGTGQGMGMGTGRAAVRPGLGTGSGWGQTRLVGDTHPSGSQMGHGRAWGRLGAVPQVRGWWAEG